MYNDIFLILNWHSLAEGFYAVSSCRRKSGGYILVAKILEFLGHFDHFGGVWGHNI